MGAFGSAPEVSTAHVESALYHEKLLEWKLKQSAYKRDIQDAIHIAIGNGSVCGENKYCMHVRGLYIPDADVDPVISDRLREMGWPKIGKVEVSHLRSDSSEKDPHGDEWDTYIKVVFV